MRYLYNSSLNVFLNLYEDKTLGELCDRYHREILSTTIFA